MNFANPFGLRDLELATGLVFGAEPAQPQKRLVIAPPSTSARAWLEAAVLPALLRPPCLVSFSGGRDSSVVLSLAAAVARREGLESPIPATNRFPRLPETDESQWQERVVSHLRLHDWHRFDHDEELDAVGPYARRGLLRHGLLWPFNVHFHLPLLDAARGGSLLTGIGGDEAFGASAWARVADVLGRRTAPRWRDAIRVAVVLAPKRVRAHVLRRRTLERFEWLTPEGHEALRSEWSAHAAGEPLRWLRRLAWFARLRSTRVGLASLQALATDGDVHVGHPFAEAAAAGAFGELTQRVVDRTTALSALAGDLLPRDVCERRSKAMFDGAFWREPARAFAATLDGDFPVPQYVDPRALRREWAGGAPNSHSFLLAQALWLSRQQSLMAATSASATTSTVSQV